ncbi:uncharacterized protein G2W53_041157 [Senna tora]|uniref:Uncharacterized protein n=1 Tax=Senna tora TaxID=362788 RepID=A0A834SF96_9FABA|nr:uncharacterized protein G2W53_041157 [Senna tora]
MNPNSEEGDQKGTSKETQERKNSGKRNTDLQEENLKVKEENLNLRKEMRRLRGEAKQVRPCILSRATNRRKRSSRLSLTVIQMLTISVISGIYSTIAFPILSLQERPTLLPV